MMGFMGMPVYGIPEIVLSITASVVSITLFLYPTPSFFRLYREWKSNRKVQRVQPYPSCLTMVACFLWIHYAMLTKVGSASKFRLSCLVLVNGLGFLVQFVHMALSKPHWTDHQLKTLKKIYHGELLLIIVPAFLIVLFDILSDPETKIVFGFASTVSGIVMYASTIPSIVDAYITQNKNYLPLGLCTMHFLNAVAWFAYALYTPEYDVYLAVANGAGIILGIVQLLICCILVVQFRKSGSKVNTDIVPTKTPLLDSIV